jgi:hypothetical protein
MSDIKINLQMRCYCGFLQAIDNNPKDTVARMQSYRQFLTNKTKLMSKETQNERQKFK